jgi:hypothetical protein
MKKHLNKPTTFSSARVDIAAIVMSVGGAAQELTAAISAMRRSRASASGRALHGTGVLSDATTVQSHWG